MLRRIRTLFTSLLFFKLAALSAWLVVHGMLRRSRVSAEYLADPDSRFVQVNGLRMHYKLVGQGETAFVLLHGSFLSCFSWREVLTPLSKYGKVIAFDRPAFGLTDRPLSGKGYDGNPYSPETQADLTVALLDQLGLEKVVLVGNSTGGTIAMLAALRHPERVQALVLADAMVYSGYAVSEFPAWLHPWLRRMSLPGTLLIHLMISSLHSTAIRSFWHNRERVTSDVLAEYRKALRMKNWDAALWALTCSTHALGLAQQLGKIRMPVLVISGESDHTVPTNQSVRLANALPDADLVVIPNCGHVPQEECPEDFTRAVDDFMRRIQDTSNLS